MKVVCSYCKVLKSDDGKADGLVSHGICLACDKKVNAELDELLAKKQKEKNQNGKVN